MKPIFRLPDSFDTCNLVGGIVAHSDFVLPNDDEKRHSEAAIETATRSGKMRRWRKPSFSDPFTAEAGHSPDKERTQRKGKVHAGKALFYKLIKPAGFQILLRFAIQPFLRCDLGLSVKNPPTPEIGFGAKKELLRGY